MNIELISKMEEQLDGIWYKFGDYSFNLPKVSDSKDVSEVLKTAVSFFKKNIAGISTNSLNILENVPVTLPQTMTIFEGMSVSGLSIKNVNKVVDFGRAAECLIDLINAKQSLLSKQSICKIHSFASKSQVASNNCGVFRRDPVYISKCSYIPPAPFKLDSIFENGIDFINKEISNPIEKAFVSFLFLSRSQFFYDVNKRTASLIMNGLLVQNGFVPFEFNDQENFNDLLVNFYETGNANDFMEYFNNNCEILLDRMNQAKGIGHAPKKTKPKKRD